MNLTGSGSSLTFGGRGLHYTIGAKGSRFTASIPGTGISWTQYSPHEKQDVSASLLPSESYSASPTQLTTAPELSSIESASAKNIVSLSTSELAPILNQANGRLPFSPIVLITCGALFIVTLLQPNQLLTKFSALSAAVCFSAVFFLDRYRRSIKVSFEPDGLVARILETLKVAFAELTRCTAVWTVSAEGQTNDWKRNAGATTLNNRKKAQLGLDRPRCIRSDTLFPTFKNGREELYLLPDAALVIISGEIASVSYRELEFQSSTVRFIENASVPSDTTIADYTWRFVNRKGGPDRRFRFNKQLPVCLYGEIFLQSASGLNCKFQISKSSAAASLEKLLMALKTTEVELPKSVTYIKLGKRWPTYAFLVVFILLSAIQIDFLARSNFKTFTSPSQTAISSPAQQYTGVSEPKLHKKMEAFPAEPPRKPTSLEPGATSPTTLPVGGGGNPPLETSNLDAPESLRRSQARLQELGYLRGITNSFDSATRAAIRDFKAVNGLSPDDVLDERTQKQIASNTALRKEQTYIGAWSENTCEPNVRPDITISSRRAVSSIGGTCEFSNVRNAASSWSMSTTCTNSGEKWTAQVRLAVLGGKLIWTGRDGSETIYVRCK